MSLEVLLELEASGKSLIFQSRDFKEGRAAFIEKRDAKFLGY